ncbi:MAG: prolipoprotein diacylglyceryl transferase [Mariniblastus sp.]|nr:prolipoprotein diacylglyceryl transferase [Mariniblastus sp.]
MQQTLFHIPHALFDGWLLAIWLVIGLAMMGYQWLVAKRRSDALGLLPIIVIVGLVIHFVLPGLENRGINPEDPQGDLIPLGLAIRGYGFFMLLAIAAGLGLVYWRCQQVGFEFDRMMSLCFWVIVLGLVGARLFYVIQKWDEFAGAGDSNLIFKMLDMTKGGLVVYGSLIGGLLGAMGYIILKKMSWSEVGDILAPALVLGLAIGRIGCLMNGCCYGGICQSPHPGIAFPAGSPPYMQQLATGPLLGVEGTWNLDGLRVETVEPASLAESRGIQPGDQLMLLLPSSIDLKAVKQQGIQMPADLVIGGPRIGQLKLSAADLPDFSLPVHPTQVYSSINALLLCLVLWFYYPFRKHSGEVLAWMLILYPVGRFFLEAIRTDELGQFGTTLTISQWVSIGTILVGFALLIYIRSKTPTLPDGQPV